MNVKVPLEEYKIPSEVRYNVNSGGGNVSCDLRDILDNKTVGPHIYREKFHALLYLEELQMEVDIRRFDLKDAVMKKTANLISLEVKSHETLFALRDKPHQSALNRPNPH